MALTKAKLIADGVIDVDNLAAGHSITTSNIGEGSNLYYTDARVASYLTTNSYATEGYVTTAVANLVDSAPSTLDTLNELAAALGDDPNFATTVTNSIATKLPLSGGNITGNFSVDTNTLFVDAANNFVGIGTTSPAANLTVVKSGSGTYMRVGGDDVGGGRSLVFTSSDTTSVGTTHTLNASSGDGVLAFATASAERMRIDANGNVGIGTASPQRPLTIYNSNSATLYQTPTSGTGANDGFYVGQTNDISYVWNYNNFPLLLATNNTERMRITSSGNVGIGTSSPLSLLDIENSNGSTLTIGTAAAFGSIASKKFTTINFNGFANDTMAQIQSWDESFNTNQGYLTFSTRTGATLTEKMRILPTGGMTVTNGNIAMSNGYGIDFSATGGAAGRTSSLLDDYEEGTWTMGIAFGGNSVGVTYGANAGTYTKIGRQVTVTGYILMTNKGSSTGEASISGLPFAVPAGTFFYGGATIGFNKNITFANQMLSVIERSDNRITIREVTEAGSLTSLDQSNFANNSEIMITATYFTS